MDSLSALSDASNAENVLDPSIAIYFDSVVPHRVFIQDGDTFIGKHLILLFQRKKFAIVIEASEEASTASSSSSERDMESVLSVEEEENVLDSMVPAEVFQGFLKPENVRDDEDEQFWDYQMLGEFNMDLISPQDYEYVLSLKSGKIRKQYLYSLFRKLKEKSEKETTEEKKMEFQRYSKSVQDNNNSLEKPYEIYTTLKHPDQFGRGDARYTYLNDVKVIQLCHSDVIQTCGIIVFNIFMSNEPSDLDTIRETIEAIVPNFKTEPTLTPSNQHVLVISNLLSWALTKQFYDEEGEPKPFSERRFKKRKPHLDYQHVFELESFCVATKADVKQNTRLGFHVIGSGIPYGLEEDIFYHWFSLGYKNEDLTTLPVINTGDNLVPTIHIDELVKIVDYIIENPTSVKKTYCIAMENVSSTLQEIVSVLSKIFTKSEAVDNVTLEEFQESYPEDLLYSSDEKKTALDLLSTHLPMESIFHADFVDQIDLKDWSFTSDIRKILKEFFKSHKLTSVKILIHGPQACGKSELARKLAEHYGLKYLNPEHLLESQQKKLREQIQDCEEQLEQHRMDNASEVSFVENEDEQSSNQNQSIDRLSQQIMAHMEELREVKRLIMLKDSTNKAKRAAFERDLAQMYVKILKTKYVEWHGYVMDDWPNTDETCRFVFSKIEDAVEEETATSDHETSDKDEADEDENGALEVLDKTLLPDIVISLEGCSHLMSDQSDIFITNTQPHSMHELSATSMNPQAENEDSEEDFYNPDLFIQFFNNIDVFPLIFNVEEQSIDEIYENLLACLGRPRFLLGEDYRRELDEKRRQEELELEQLQEEILKMAEKTKKEEYERMEQWADMNNILHFERNIIQELHRLPLRHYLMKYVMPSVTRGMNDVTRTKPEDPLDYLVEYFFKENSEFKITNAHHNAKAELFWQCLAFMKNKLKES